MDILRVKGLMWGLESLKNQSESWKSAAGNLFLKKGTNPVYSTLWGQVYVYLNYVHV